MTQTHVSTLLSTEQIAARVRELGAQIEHDYRDRRLVLVSVLKGSFVFTADLARQINIPLRVEFLGVTIDDRFVVGYGLDAAERYRNLPYIGVVEAGP